MPLLCSSRHHVAAMQLKAPCHRYTVQIDWATTNLLQACRFATSMPLLCSSRHHVTTKRFKIIERRQICYKHAALLQACRCYAARNLHPGVRMLRPCGTLWLPDC
jgi:hypothetical protein